MQKPSAEQLLNQQVQQLQLQLQQSQQQSEQQRQRCQQLEQLVATLQQQQQQQRQQQQQQQPQQQNLSTQLSPQGSAQPTIICCPECLSPLKLHPRGRPSNWCDGCRQQLVRGVSSHGCDARALHAKKDVFDLCSQCTKLASQDQRFFFNLQKWVCSQSGRLWVEQVIVRIAGTNVKFCAPPVQWEDIDRHTGSSQGRMIYDVVVNMATPSNSTSRSSPQSEPSNGFSFAFGAQSRSTIRYILRPDNFTDTVQKRSATDITLPIGQLAGQPLRSAPLANLLTPQDGSYPLLRQCGFAGAIKGSLYVPDMDGGPNSSGGIAFSSGVTLLSIQDVGQAYEMEVYMYPTYGEFANAKTLCLVQTIEGTTCNLISPGKKSVLRFGKDNKECMWRIARFDTSTAEGVRNERTGCDPATDMMIYFIPVRQGPLPQPGPRLGSGFGGGFGGIGGFEGGGGGPGLFGSSTGFSFGSAAQSASSTGRGVGFAKHEMFVTEKTFESQGSKEEHPLERIKELPIRGFLRGATFVDRAPTRHDALAISDYLESKYNDEELTSIWGYCAQARARARILPICPPNAPLRRGNGVLTREFSEYAIKNREFCVVCIASPITHVLQQCGHMCLCRECSTGWRFACPICRGDVQAILPEEQVDKSAFKIIPQAVKD